MPMHDVKRFRCGYGAALLAVTILIVAGFVGVEPPVLAADSSPVLVVPSSKTTLHLAVDLPQQVRLDTPGRWHLTEIDRPDAKIPVQLVPAIAADGSQAEKLRRVLADVPPRDGAGRRRRFRLEASDRSKTIPFRFEDVSDQSLKLSDGDQPVLVYNHGTITDENVPQRDHRRSRACYVHPLWGVGGELLTADFPKDHYHHHGIFWTWPHVEVDGKRYDIWAGPNIKDKFVRWICRETGPAAAVLAVENGWFVGDKKVMIERVWLRTYRVTGDSRVLDLEFVWIPTDRPVKLWGAGGKSYGGLTVRFAVGDQKEAVITVPSGRTTADLAETRLPWADLTYPFDAAAGPSGAAIFIHPDHPDYPPTWLTRHYGPLCVGWPGVKAKTFQPDQPIRLNYRIWIHKTAVGLDELKQAYEGYMAAAKVRWE